MITFRIDDVSVNTDMERLVGMILVVREFAPDADVLLAVSPFVHDMSAEVGAARGRVFPKVLGAMSDHRVFLRPERLGVPRVPLPGVRYASHGLFHMDHRLLGREAQEMSILASCALVGSKVYVPPFNKYDADTLAICAEHGIELVRFEDGWRHVLHNGFDPSFSRYYVHPHDVSPEDLRAWFLGL